MTKQDIEKKVKEALIDVLGQPKEDITSRTFLIEDLGMDSFASLELVFALEDALGIEISTEDAKGFVRVKDVLQYIENVLAQYKGEQHAH